MLPLADITAKPDPSHMIAYLAGFFDGEGCIRVMCNRAPTRKGQSPVYRLLAIVNQRADHAMPLHLLKEAFGGNVVKGGNQQGKANPTLSWQIAGKPAANAIQLMLPYLTVKRAAAYAGLAFHHWKEIMMEFRPSGKRLTPFEIMTGETFTKFFYAINSRELLVKQPVASEIVQ